MRVIGFVFSGRGQDGDFSWMIEQDRYKDALFIFNDNEGQYKEHRDNPGDLTGPGCQPGGGNAVIRPYQCSTPPRAAGIPTGPNYDHVTPDVKHTIDDAIAAINASPRRKATRGFSIAPPTPMASSAPEFFKLAPMSKATLSTG
jgi:hypothetical protein